MAGLTHSNTRQSLELYVLENAGPLKVRLTSGSGNQLGDGDIKPTHKGNSHTPELGFEMKDRSTSPSHSVPSRDWEKAKTQIKLNGAIPVFVTRNSQGEVLAHLRYKDLIGIIQGYEWTIEEMTGENTDA